MKYTAIRSEGGLLPYDLLDEILTETAPGQKPADFGLPKGRRLSDEIQRVWSDAQELWSRFKAGREKLSEKDPHGTTLTRDRWIGPLLTDPVRLSYDLHYQSSAIVLDGLTFAISHRAGEAAESPPVHIEGCDIELDKRPPKYRTSPQAMVQEFLNRSEPHLWGVATNGLRFRLLRDSVRTARPTYLEFDLETILEGGNYSEFALFYRLCHRTRLPQPGRPPEDCLLEKYYLESIEKGGRVRENLRDGVEEALKVLGTGFLRHPENPTLKERVGSGALNADQYHRQLLLLVYRLLFLAVAEDRHLIISVGESADRNQGIYRDYYSIGKLRERAEGILDDSGFSDLWSGLTQTFKLFADSNDTNPLGIPPLNGDLFSHITIPDLEGAQLSNLDLLKAVRWLMFYRERNVQQRVNYAALNVEELGSVYESLLDFQPLAQNEADGWRFDLGVGSERKTTGSYYTRPELVRELVESTLVPVIDNRLTEAEKQSEGKSADEIQEEKSKAILEISVCDPACGSGHFLLEAARRLGKELARIRAGEDEPTPEQFHIAVRDVTSHCINPLAVDLCKLALWLEGHWAGKPLSFLDHRIRCGNSLIGVLDPSIFEEGIPDEAFASITGDDKKVASAFKKRNKYESNVKSRSQQQFDFGVVTDEHLREYVGLAQRLSDLREDRPEDVRQKAILYEQSRANVHWFHDSQVANAWTGVFFLPLVKHNDPALPTYETFAEFLYGHVHQPQFLSSTEAIACEYKFFHWFLEFPEVFDKGGFDVVLGNPPWDVLQPEEQVFFRAAGATEIANAAGNRRKKLIADLESQNAELAKAWNQHRRSIEVVNKFAKWSGRFPLTSGGRNNSYTLFAELSSALINGEGRSGLVLPIGIVTEETSSEFFGDLVTRKRLRKVLGFENESFIFKGVHHAFKFCAVTVSGSPDETPADFTFFCRHFEDIADPARRFTLSTEQLSLLSPNTRTCPVFRTGVDAKLTSKLFLRAPVLINTTSENNPWGLRLQQGLFHMTGDSHLFEDAPSEGLLPLYEAKMFHQFDHRWATFEDGDFRDVSVVEKCDPHFEIKARYWVSQAHVQERLADAGFREARVLLVFRNIGRAVDVRTGLFAFIPTAGVGHSASIIFFKLPMELQSCLLANLNCLVFDYVLRQKVPGINISFPYLQQVPALEPKQYREEDTTFVSERVIALNFTSEQLQSALCSGSMKVSLWNEEARPVQRAELDAYYAHLYGMTRDELRYVLDPKDVFGRQFPSETFRVLMEREVREYGEYRTQRLVLSAFDDFSLSDRFRGDERDCTITGKTWKVGA